MAGKHRASLGYWQHDRLEMSRNWGGREEVSITASCNAHDVRGGKVVLNRAQQLLTIALSLDEEQH